jgi:hypothetical protein
MKIDWIPIVAVLVLADHQAPEHGGVQGKPQATEQNTRQWFTYKKRADVYSPVTGSSERLGSGLRQRRIGNPRKTIQISAITTRINLFEAVGIFGPR